jgi:hypothetical protein
MAIKPKEFAKAEGKLFFFSAPPLKGVRESKRKLPNPPFKGSKPWQRSVFYYWWEYLRRHEGYRECCSKKGIGPYRELYRDFGNVHEGEFWDWWKARGQYLFSEPPALQVQKRDAGSIDLITSNEVLISVPLTQSMAVTIRQFRKVMVPLLKWQRAERKKSRALYQVAAKPILPALHTHLRIWDIHIAHPDWTYHKIADAAGIIVATGSRKTAKDLEANDPWTNHRKTLAVSRHLRIAKAYIENVAFGSFPALSINRNR